MSGRLGPGFAVFNYHVNDAQAKARKIFITTFGREKWDETVGPLEESGIMAIFDQELTLYYTFYITTVTLIVNGDVIVPPCPACAGNGKTVQLRADSNPVPWVPGSYADSVIIRDCAACA
jgi:hypothetical protein